MITFQRRDERRVSAEFSVYERMLLHGLVEQLIDILGEPSDPAMERLFPTAYPDDAEAAADFRRFTADGLAERKTLNARAVLDAVGPVAVDGETVDGGTGPHEFEAGDSIVVLDEQQATNWLRALTDLRLVLANRLGIQGDDDEGRMDVDAEPLQQAYFWLGALQESLVNALDA